MKKIIVTLLTLASLSTAVYAQTFPGTGVGSIPDGPGVPTTCGSPGTPLDVSFAVSDVFAPLIAVEVDIEINHTWVNDISAVLIDPMGTEHILFARTGAVSAAGCGDGSDLGGVYNFTDEATGINWWTNANSNPVATGDFKTTESGGDGQVDPAPTTDMSPIFASLADPNGTWILRVTDGGAADLGDIVSANLFLVGGLNPDIIFANDFEQAL